ncbi:MAG TPA: hypothetical protein VJG90_00155 [Candidatus Nanoarchaeia archaeon]|nr:hypothetical protein [Candidatus Nanoarchaeia archaeon]
MRNFGKKIKKHSSVLSSSIVEGKKNRQLSSITGQLWSTDVLIGVAIFIGVIALFYISLSLNSTSDYPMLKEEAQMATNRLLKPDSATNILTSTNELNQTRLSELGEMDYSALRDKLGIRGEYCLYLEDSRGRIIPISTDSGKKSGIGNPALNVSGTLCGDYMAIPPPP